MAEAHALAQELALALALEASESNGDREVGEPLVLRADGYKRLITLLDEVEQTHRAEAERP